MRVVFMGTPYFAVPSLERLLERRYDVCAVVTQPDRRTGRGRLLSAPAVKQAATDAGLNVMQPATLRDPSAVAGLRELAPDVIVVVAYGQILRPTVLEIPRLGCVNIHPSLLPRWRGAAPIQAVIRAGEPRTGVTIMRMDVRMDAGPILDQIEVGVSPEESTPTLSARLAAMGADRLVHTLDRLETGAIEPRPQDEAEATYCRPLRKEDADIDWSRTADDIARISRAQTPWPGCQGFWLGKQVRLLGLTARNDWSGREPPGTVIEWSGVQIAIATGSGAVEINQIQLAGKKPLSSADFLRGQSGFMGARLEAPARPEVPPLPS